MLGSNLKINKWKNKYSVIKWFKKIEDANLYEFLMFDIKDFYPSIKDSLFYKALQFTKKHVNIAQKEIEVMFYS